MPKSNRPQLVAEISEICGIKASRSFSFSTGYFSKEQLKQLLEWVKKAKKCQDTMRSMNNRLILDLTPNKIGAMKNRTGTSYTPPYGTGRTK